MKKATLKKHEGFSLIELVIVVAIIGILALMILPQFNTVTEDAKRKTWEANCQNVVAAIGMYQAAHAGQLPGAIPTDPDDFGGDDDPFTPYISGGFPKSDENSTGPKAEYSYVDGQFIGTWTGTEGVTEDSVFRYPTNN